MINFDEWAELARSNPEEFERRRKELLDEEIRKSPEENKSALLSLQVQCDAIRSLYYDNPEQASAIILKMAGERLNRLRAPLTEMREIAEDLNESLKNDNSNSSDWSE